MDARYLTAAEVAERVAEFEDRRDVLRYQAGGWCIWPLVKFGAYRALQHVPFEKHAGQPVPRWQLYRTALADVPRYLRPPRARHLALVQDANRSEQAGGRYKDIFFDNVIAAVDGFVKLEHLFNPIFFPARRSSLIPSDLTTALLRLLAGRGQRLVPARALADVGPLARLVAGELGLAHFTEAWLGETVRSFLAQERIYRHLLARMQPRTISMVTAYGEHAAVAAARRLGIIAVDFQHGIADRNHPGYSWTARALGYKSSMPVVDRVFCYGDYWAEELRARGFWGADARPVGSPRLDQFRDQRAAIDRAEPLVVVTTQGVDTRRLLGFLQAFLAAAPPQLRVVVKLHPAEEIKQNYSEALGADPRVRILLSSEPPFTFDLLTRADYHVSIYSACHWEAIGLGVPTVIVPLSGHDNVLPLHARGHALLARTPVELAEIVTSGQRAPAAAAAAQGYFAKGAVANIKRELERG